MCSATELEKVYADEFIGTDQTHCNVIRYIDAYAAWCRDTGRPYSHDALMDLFEASR